MSHLPSDRVSTSASSPLVKICGITNPDDAIAAVDAGADFLGFIFVPGTPRYIQPECAAEIVSVVRARLARARCKDLLSVESGSASGVGLIGVFADERFETVCSIMKSAGLDYAQLHGSESVDYLKAFGSSAYKAIRPRSSEDALETISKYRLEASDPSESSVPGVQKQLLPAFLIDAFDPKSLGGTGIKADWSVAFGLARRYRLLLAGGLTPENVADAIGSVRPWGVDVSSGVECSPGRKDHEKLRRFIAEAKGLVK